MDRCYNKEQKIRYINKKIDDGLAPQSVDGIKRYFYLSTKIEKDLNKDLSNWSFYEIQEFYKLIGTYSYYYLRNMNLSFMQYTNFCLQNGLVEDGQNHYIEITDSIIADCLNKKIINKKIIDRDTLIGWIQQLKNPRDQFILLGLFELGKSKDFYDIVNLKPQDIDWETNTIRLSDRHAVISNELMRIIENCIEVNVYYSMTGKQEQEFPLVDNGTILKAYHNTKDNVSDFQKGRNIYNALKRIFSYLGVIDWMNAMDLCESGKFDYVTKRSEELRISKKTFIEEHIEEINKRFNCKIEPTTLIKKWKSYL